MQWTIDNINREAFQVLGIKSDELIILQGLLKKQLVPQQKRLEKLRDIHDAGEATSKQEDKYLSQQDIVSTLEYFLIQ